MMIIFNPFNISQLSVISYQLSVISYQLSVISYQLSVISFLIKFGVFGDVSSTLFFISYYFARFHFWILELKPKGLIFCNFLG
jgi:hypothetical protein